MERGQERGRRRRRSGRLDGWRRHDGGRPKYGLDGRAIAVGPATEHHRVGIDRQPGSREGLGQRGTARRRWGAQERRDPMFAPIDLHLIDGHPREPGDIRVGHTSDPRPDAIERVSATDGHRRVDGGGGDSPGLPAPRHVHLRLACQFKRAAQRVDRDAEPLGERRVGERVLHHEQLGPPRGREGVFGADAHPRSVLVRGGYRGRSAAHTRCRRVG